MLLIEWFNTNVRSAVISLAITVLSAGIEVLYAQTADQKYNWGLVAGAAVAAGIKFLHSAISRAVIARGLDAI